jgi:hypothetical protein
MALQKNYIKNIFKNQGIRKSKQEAKELSDELDKVKEREKTVQDMSVTINQGIYSTLNWISIIQLLRFSYIDLNQIFNEGELTLGNVLSLATSAALLVGRLNQMLATTVKLQAVASLLTGTFGKALGIGVLFLGASRVAASIKNHTKAMQELNRETLLAITYQKELSGELGRTAFNAKEVVTAYRVEESGTYSGTGGAGVRGSRRERLSFYSTKG